MGPTPQQSPRKHSLGGVFSAPEHNPPPQAANKKPMEELTKSGERLSVPKKVPEPKDGHMLSPRVVKSKEEIDKGCERLYNQSIEKQKKAREKAEEAQSQPLAKTTVVSPEELQFTVANLYQQAIDRKRTANEKLREKYLFTQPPSPRVDVAAVNARVYTDALKKREERLGKDHEKYVTQSLPKYRKVTPEEIAASGARLCQRKA